MSLAGDVLANSDGIGYLLGPATAKKGNTPRFGARGDSGFGKCGATC